MNYWWKVLFTYIVFVYHLNSLKEKTFQKVFYTWMVLSFTFTELFESLRYSSFSSCCNEFILIAIF